MKSKNVIRINESQLKQMISESVKKVLKEEKTERQINWPAEGYFWDIKMNDGSEMDLPQAGATSGYKTKDEAFYNMIMFYQQNYKNINFISGPYIGIFD